MKKFDYNDKQWFNQEKEVHTKFSTIKLNEKDKNLRYKIKNQLIEVLIHYYVDAKTIELYLDDDEQFSELEQVLHDEYIPSHEAEDTRKGDFSEIISSEHLVQNYGYYFPYIKLQHKPNKDQSNQGDDILGFIFNNDGKLEKICVGEVKFSSSFNNGVFKKAHTQLKNSYSPTPKSLSMIVNYVIQYNNKHSKELQKILSKKNFDKKELKNWIFCVTEDNPNELYVPNEEELLDNLTLVTISLPEIVNFIHEIYDLSSGFYNERK